MATHSSILAWRIPMDGGTWRATVQGVTESDTTERPNSNNNPNSITTLEVGYSAEPWSRYGTELQFLRLKN